MRTGIWRAHGRQSGARSLLMAMRSACCAEPALAQKPGGILKILAFRQPGQHVDPRGGDARGRAADDGRLQQPRHVRPARRRKTASTSIVPDLATSWAWSEDGKELTFPLRQGVKWHDGKPFTAADVKCTWDLLLGRAARKLRVNPRKAWYRNLERGHDQRRLRGHLSSEAAAAGVARRCSPPGWSPVYPCHVSPARHAPASDRHRPVQIRRVQAERVRSR